jgi:hypothetical protein
LCDPKYSSMIHTPSHIHTPNFVHQKGLTILMHHLSVFPNLITMSLEEPLILRLWFSWMRHCVIWYKASSVWRNLLPSSFVIQASLVEEALFQTNITALLPNYMTSFPKRLISVFTHINVSNLTAIIMYGILPYWPLLTLHYATVTTHTCSSADRPLHFSTTNTVLLSPGKYPASNTVVSGRG